MQSGSEFLDASQVAGVLGMPLAVILRLIASGELPAVRFGDRWQVRSELLPDLRQAMTWQQLSLGIGFLGLDELSEIVLTKAARRFGLDPVATPSGEALLEHVETGACSVVAMAGCLPSGTEDALFAQIRRIAPDLPVAMVADASFGSTCARFLLKGGPITVVEQPLYYHHAENLLSHFGFERQPLV